MRINIVSVLVDDQEKALKFYTEALGFQKVADIPVGEYRNCSPFRRDVIYSPS